MNLKINKLVVTKLEVNCYILFPSEHESPSSHSNCKLVIDGHVLETPKSSDESVSHGKKPCVIIDPGGDVDKIESFLKQNNLFPALVILTHSHYDHIGATQALGCPICAHSDSQDHLKDPKLNMSSIFGKNVSIQINYPVEEGSKLIFGDEEFQFIHTPGHSPGSMCLHNDTIMFSGDTVFDNGFGRFDLVGGNISLLKKSLRRIIDMPGDFKILPGHGSETTLSKARIALSFFAKQ